MQDTAQKYGYGQLTVTVDMYVQNVVVCVVFKLQPSAAAGHRGRIKYVFSVFVQHMVAVNAGRTYKLRYDNALRAVYDKSAGFGH